MKFTVRSCRTQKSFSPFEYISVLIHIPLTRLLPHTDAASSESYQGSRLKQLKQMHCLVQSFLFWLGMRLGQFRERLKSGAVSAEHNCVSICCSNCLILWRECSGLKCSFNQEKASFRIKSLLQERSGRDVCKNIVSAITVRSLQYSVSSYCLCKPHIRPRLTSVFSAFVSVKEEFYRKRWTISSCVCADQSTWCFPNRKLDKIKDWKWNFTHSFLYWCSHELSLSTQIMNRLTQSQKSPLSCVML